MPPCAPTFRIVRPHSGGEAKERPRDIACGAKTMSLEGSEKGLHDFADLPPTYHLLERFPSEQFCSCSYRHRR